NRHTSQMDFLVEAQRFALLPECCPSYDIDIGYRDVAAGPRAIAAISASADQLQRGLHDKYSNGSSLCGERFPCRSRVRSNGDDLLAALCHFLLGGPRCGSAHGPAHTAQPRRDSERYGVSRCAVDVGYW